MKTWVRKTLAVGVLAAGALLFGPAAAHADAGHHHGGGNSGPIQATGMNNGIANGTQLAVPVSVPLNIVGNAIGVAGEANSAGAGVNNVESGHVGQVTGANNGILNGTQAYLPINVPVNVVGNSAAILGAASSTGVGANHIESARTESAQTTEGGHWGSDGQWTGANNGIGNGTQIYAPISVPVNVCGNSFALLGAANSGAICGNDVFGGDDFLGGGNRKHKHHGESAQVTQSGHAAQVTGANNGILNGTQLYAPISLPVNLAGNSLGVLGVANSRAVAGNKVSESANGGWGGQVTGQNNGILNGTQIAAPISVPINVCGNSLGILGAASSSAACFNNVGGDLGGSWGGGHNGGGHDGGWDNGGWDNGGDNGHGGHGGHQGHGNGGQNAGDNGDKDYGNKGDHGNKGNGNGGNGNGDANSGYGDQGDQGTAPTGNGDANSGYGAVSPATGSDSKSKGGRQATDTESSPVSSLTSSVSSASDSSGLGGLGLLNTLR